MDLLSMESLYMYYCTFLRWGQREVVISIYLIIALSKSNTFAEHLESSSQTQSDANLRISESNHRGHFRVDDLRRHNHHISILPSSSQRPSAETGHTFAGTGWT
ncbi:uncharacterized protein LOC121797411 isoform X2 [Salvia splendens]|uniref:uncharacterized protein LOC121797411 isoform X2 n=1 Tax=Salvia splendens TaxID=180675 RepID=UPI001C27F59C|nr:uncharacterized protein LOC121797411 isoform X2 [Salvia splendens]